MTSGIGGQTKQGWLWKTYLQYNAILGMSEHTRLEVIFKDLGGIPVECVLPTTVLYPQISPFFMWGMLSLWCSGQVCSELS